MQDQSFYWEERVGVCTDRAASIIGCHSKCSRKNKTGCKQRYAVNLLHNSP